ncbi:DUF4339 domain-containing protein [Methyloligella solikamskensis]|uniref:DUF4339 domain-containing protein n=1 Tax=Methyloligella solikamskensis TaxID=1177756 RepID=A0ABW3JAM8_9HYPH
MSDAGSGQSGSGRPVTGSHARTSPPPHPLDRCWYIYINGQSSGPTSGHQIRSLQAAGQISGEDYVFPEGGNEWVLLKDDAILSRLLDDKAPPPPAIAPREVAPLGTQEDMVRRAQDAAHFSADGSVGPYSPGVAALLSFLICGAGQMYNGQLGKGFLFLIACVLLWFILLGWVVWIIAIIDAFKTAKRLNIAHHERVFGKA